MKRDYRLLKPGEPIKVGDEYLRDNNGSFGWTVIPAWSMPTDGIGLFRRPATGPDSAGQMIEVLEAEIAFLRQLLAQKESA